MTKYRLIPALGTIAILFGISTAPANAQDVGTLTAAPLGNFGIIFSESLPSTTTNEVTARWTALLDDCRECSTGVTVGGKVVVINWEKTIFDSTSNDGYVMITQEQYNEYQRLKSYCDENHCGD